MNSELENTPEIFTAEDIEQGEFYGNLGPEYFAARRMSERAMAAFQADMFKPLIDEFSDKLSSELWSRVEGSLVEDVERNIQSHICQMVEGTIDALLTGKEWAMRRYPYADYSRGQEIRAAVAKHGGEGLLNQRIADLEKEVETLRGDNEWLRGR